MTPDPAPPFEFDMSGALRERVRRMLVRATELGVGQPIALALRAIMDAVTNRPREWGDPVRHFQHSQLTYYHGHHANFLAEYSVHDRVPMVFLINIVPLPGSPLHGENFDEDS